MTNIIGILASAGPNSLVLLDELGAGTDPDEGSALARAIIERLLETGCLTVATTHHGELKVFAHTTTGVMNASVEFDVETLAPTYRISIGLPGSSNALAIAERLGLPRDVVEVARGSIDPERAHAESLLAEIQRERAAAEDARRAELLARKEAEEIRLRLEEKLDALEEEREQILANARAEAEEELSRVRQLLAHAGRRIERQKPEAAAEKVAAAEAVAETLKPPPPSPGRRRRKGGDLILPEEIQPGDIVWVRGLGRFGEALSSPDDKGEVEIRLGSLHSTVPLKKVEKVQRLPKHATKAHAPVATGGSVTPPPPSVSMELEVRGRLVDEVLPDLDKYLDDAFRAGLPWVRIVHGKGTGALARAVRHMLSSHPLVKDYAVAPREEGGEGVTIAHLAS
jgi:DNA mismatch repair protein MutS2